MANDASSRFQLRVTLASKPEPYELTTRLMDHHMFDVERSKRKWPSPGESVMTWLGFLAYAASRRAGKIPASTTWEDFLADCDEVVNLTDDDEGEGVADPTP
jgi:hypothetical protein